MALRAPVFASLAVLWAVAGWSAEVLIPRGATQPGRSFSTSIQFLGQGSQLAGLQFDLGFNSSLVVSPSIGSASTSAGKSVLTADLSAGKKRFLIVGLNQNIISDGVVVSLNVAVPADSGTTQYSLDLSNAQATDRYGNAITLLAADGAIAVQPPATSISSVVSSASFRSAAADGSWISILGTNLAPHTRTWTSAEIIAGKLPTSLDGVSVTIAGLPAAISFISSTQLNVQVPATGRTGPVDVTVTNPAATTAAASATLQRNAPGVFVFEQGGGKYAAALIARIDGGVDYLGPQGLFGQTLASRPARPGEIIELYGTGLGPTIPAVPAGQLFSGAASLADPVTVRIGGVPATVGFAGITAAGLDQINVTVPAVGPGDQSLVVDVNGILSQSGVYVTVGR